ncbi:hypothetical protein TYRP_001495 [Tyrophagus putrescentiae]|nr:hypothetical protein TYRP_001495 [Tyrophagus putrescentiae]
MSTAAAIGMTAVVGKAEAVDPNANDAAAAAEDHQDDDDDGPHRLSGILSSSSALKATGKLAAEVVVTIAIRARRSGSKRVIPTTITSIIIERLCFTIIKICLQTKQLVDT